MGLPQGRDYQLVIQYLMVSPENIQAKQILLYLEIHTYIYIHTHISYTYA